MLRNFLTTAFRNLLRRKSSTFINLSGLTLGISCSLVLFLMISHMVSYDKFHTKRDRIYRIVSQGIDENGNSDFESGVPATLPDAFKNDFPEAEAVVFTSFRYGGLILIPQSDGAPKKFLETGEIVFTDPSFFKIFDRKVLAGDVIKGIDEPYEAVIAKQWATRYFGQADAIGKILQYDDQEYKITAIVEDAPDNTDFPFQLMLSYSTIKKAYESNGWGSVWSDDNCYFLLKEGENTQTMESKLPGFAHKYTGEDADKMNYSFQPLSELHVDDRFQTYSFSAVSKNMLTFLGVIALMLVIMACINFINLTTAEAINRSREVGIRKSLGGSRSQLIRQFLGETTMITLAAVLMSIPIVQVLLSFINPFLGYNLSLQFGNTVLWIYVLSLTAFVSLLSGLYPAFIVSGFSPILALKNQATNRQSSGYTLRSTLVVVQFAFSQLFIIGTIVVTRQMQYAKQKDLGFSKEAIVSVPIPAYEEESKLGKNMGRMKTLRNEILHITGVENATLNNYPPSSGNALISDIKLANSDREYDVQVKQIDENYLDVFKLLMLEGKNVADLDTISGFIINESLLHTAGYKKPEEVIGTTARLWGKSFPVVGVVKDFHTMSLHEPIGSTVLFNQAKGFRNLSMKIDLANAQTIIDQVKIKWETAYPNDVFEYKFLQEDIERFYRSEQKKSILLTLFSSVAIFIGCLGLLGLVAFMTHQKTKEVGVRKVLGATVASIVLMFSKEFTKLIIMGFVIAAPFAWILTNKFLSEFTYKVILSWEMFLAGFTITLIIAMATIAYKSFRAAIVNPVKSLRYE